MAHGLGATVLAGFIWYWLTTYGSLAWSRWLVAGLLLGAAMLMRWQLATFAVLPAGEFLLAIIATRERLARRFAATGLAAAGAIIAFLPQMIAWRCVYGHWLVAPVPGVTAHWLNPSLWAVLFSQDRSLFYWTPIAAVALLGFFVCRRSAKTEPMALLLVAFGLQVYALASVWGQGEFLDHAGNYAGAFLSKAYGMRHLAEAVVALAPGLAALLEGASRHTHQPTGALSGTLPVNRRFERLRPLLVAFPWLCGLIFILVVANLTLVSMYIDGLLPEDEGIELSQLGAMMLTFVINDPSVLLLNVLVLALIWMVLFWQDDDAAAAVNAGAEAKEQGWSVAAAMLRWGTLILLAAGLLATAFSAKPGVGFLYRVVRNADGEEMKYALFVPHTYQADRDYPVILYLHGSGPRRWDGIRPPQEPLAAVIQEQEATFDMIAVFPESATGFWDADSADLVKALHVLEEVQKSYRVDPDRIYLTGMSRGAFGVWTLAAAHPDKWAAIVPVCGGGNPQEVPKIRHIPCWCFHGDQDQVIPVEESRRMIVALRREGGDPKYDEYPGVGHNCWDRAYRTPELFPWLRRQLRPR
jgi:poly(3-hydroxybutyrate) depolymerase